MPKTNETKCFVSDAPAKKSLEKLLEVAFSRWHVEKWFERTKQAGVWFCACKILPMEIVTNLKWMVVESNA